MTRNKINRNPKLTREQLIPILLQQTVQVSLLLDQLEVAYKKIREQEEEIKSVLRRLEQNDHDLETFLNHEIKELEEELECPVCLEVANMAPIYKCQEDHLVCRSQTFSRFQERFFVFSRCRPKLEDCPQCRAIFCGSYKRFEWYFILYYIWIWLKTINNCCSV